MAHRTPAHVLDGRLHVDDGELVCLLHKLAQHATHGGMRSAESARARVIDMSRKEERDAVRRGHPMFGSYLSDRAGESQLLRAGRVYALLDDRAGEGTEGGQSLLLDPEGHPFCLVLIR